MTEIVMTHRIEGPDWKIIYYSMYHVVASSRTRDDTENSGESLRLIDHESSTCACDSSQAEDGDSEYNNTFLHTYINNEPNKEESQTSISSQETIVPYSGSGYESPIKLRPVAYWEKWKKHIVIKSEVLHI